MGRPKKTEAQKKADAQARALAKQEKLEQEKLVQEEAEKKKSSFMDLDAELAEDEATDEVEETKIEEKEETVEDALAEIKKEPVKKRKELDRHMLVPVASFVVGTLIYKSDRTGAMYVFKEFGAEDEIELFELQAMRSAYPKYLTAPWLVILDDEVVEYLKLTELYSKIVKPEQLERFLKLKPHKIKSVLENAPKGFKDTVLSKVQILIKDNKFDSLERIRVIEEVMGIELASK